jgi:hypothetical protein
MSSRGIVEFENIGRIIDFQGLDRVRDPGQRE